MGLPGASLAHAPQWDMGLGNGESMAPIGLGHEPRRAKGQALGHGVAPCSQAKEALGGATPWG